MVRLISALLWLTAAAAGVYADGPGAFRPEPRAAIAVTLSEEGAIDAYNVGYAAIQRADHSQALAAASTKKDEKAKAEHDAKGFYKEALKHFDEATRLDASMHEAYTYIGYANRKLGNYDKALAAYQQALEIHPDYPHAIEYQGQAFLGLNRIEEARFNYLRLYALNKGQAAKLLQAMREWVATHPNKTDGLDVTSFADWVARRSEITRNDAPSSSW